MLLKITIGRRPITTLTRYINLQGHMFDALYIVQCDHCYELWTISK